jgi:hypothetical protein
VGFGLVKKAYIHRDVNEETLEVSYTLNGKTPVNVFRENSEAAHRCFDKMLLECGEKIVNKTKRGVDYIRADKRRLVKKYGEYLRLPEDDAVAAFFDCISECEDCKITKECDWFSILLNALREICER